MADDGREESEVVLGRDSDEDTEEYYGRHRHYSSSDSEETISDSSPRSVPANYGGGRGPSSAAANSHGRAASSSAVAALACGVCGKEFRSRKAVCGHMKVHKHGIGRHAEQRIGKGKGIKINLAALLESWGSTGKRGCSGTSGASSPSAQPEHSMAIVVAEAKIVLQPMPLAFATPNPSPVPMAYATPNPCSVPSASAIPNPSPVPIASTTTNVSGESSFAKASMHDDAMDKVVAGAANPTTEAVVHLHAAQGSPSPPPAGVHAASAQQQQQPIEQPPPPAAEEKQVPLPPVHQRPIARPAAGRQNPNGYTCPRCGAWYRTYQGLGGHIAGHYTRENAAAPRRRGAKPAKAHVCKTCGARFDAGVQLGGHMRKHFTGNKKPRLDIQATQLLPPPAEAAADLTLALSAKTERPSSSAPAGEAAAPQQAAPAPPVQETLEPAPRSALACRVLLFGVDIGAETQKTAAQGEGSSAIKESTFTGGEQ